MFTPEVVSGRLLLLADGRAILLDSSVAVEEGIGLGEEVALGLGRGRDSVWLAGRGSVAESADV
jgi:hypothetical protein